MEWNEPFFRDCFDNAVKMVTWVSHKQKSFTRFQMIAQELINYISLDTFRFRRMDHTVFHKWLIKQTEKKIPCGTVMLKSVETRFVSRHGMTERVIHHKKVYKTLTKDELFLTWIRK